MEYIVTRAKKYYLFKNSPLKSTCTRILIILPKRDIKIHHHLRVYRAGTARTGISTSNRPRLTRLKKARGEGWHYFQSSILLTFERKWEIERKGQRYVFLSHGFDRNYFPASFGVFLIRALPMPTSSTWSSRQGLCFHLFIDIWIVSQCRVATDDSGENRRQKCTSKTIFRKLRRKDVGHRVKSSIGEVTGRR